jgi:predicted Zn-dependent peptidase
MKPKFYRKVLKNGMTVILEKRDLPIISCAFAVRSGAIDEKLEEKGISHFIEHMFYKGTKTRNSIQIAQEIENNGGQLNGFTSETVVAYWAKMPSNKLNIALDVLSDLVKNPVFDKNEFEKERKVIFEEIKMYKDNPRMYIFEKIKQSLYDNPFGMNIAGEYKTMNSITREKMIDYYHKVYTSNNLILCVVGDADFDFLINFVKKNFSNEKSKISRKPVKEKNDTNIETRKGIDQANLIFGYHVPREGNNKSYSAEVLSALMAGGMSSRLFAEIREKRNLAYAVKGDSDIEKDFAYNFIFVGTMKKNVEKVRQLIIEEFLKVSKELDEKELNTVKDKIIGNFQIDMEDSQSQMVHLLASEISGNAKSFYEYEKNIKSVKLRDVKSLALKASKDYSFFALVPE